MRIAICDDDTAEQERFEKALFDCDPTIQAEKFADGMSLLAAAKGFPMFDMVFLDIYMPGEDGINVAKALNGVSPETGIVFVTSSREHAVDAFSVYALHYLVKPVTKEGVAEAFRRLMGSRSQQRERIILTTGAERHTVFLDQIYLLQNDNHAVNVLLTDGQKLKVWTSFSELEKQVGDKFLRINRGIAVNMDHIVQMRADTCVLREGLVLPIAVRQSSVIRAAYDNYVFDRLSRKNDMSGEE